MAMIEGSEQDMILAISAEDFLIVEMVLKTFEGVKALGITKLEIL